jgi:hypothetical protein
MGMGDANSFAGLRFAFWFDFSYLLLTGDLALK